MNKRQVTLFRETVTEEKDIDFEDKLWRRKGYET